MNKQETGSSASGMPKLRAAVHLDGAFGFANRDSSSSFAGTVGGIHAGATPTTGTA